LSARSSDYIAAGIVAKVVEVELIAEEHLLLGGFHLVRHLDAQLHGIDFGDVVLRAAAAAAHVATAAQMVVAAAAQVAVLLPQDTFRDHHILVNGIQIVFWSKKERNTWLFLIILE